MSKKARPHYVHFAHGRRMRMDRNMNVRVGKYLLAAFIVALITVMATTGAFASDQVNVIIDNISLLTDVSPRIINGRTMIPARAVSEAINCQVHWFESEERVDIYTPDDSVLILSLYIGSPVVERYFVDSAGNAVIEKETIESPPVLIEERTFVPLRIIAESLGFEVQWDEINNTVFLYRGSWFGSGIGMVDAVLSGDELLELQRYTVEDATFILYNDYIDTEAFYPGELNTVVGRMIFYGFYYDNGDTYRYVWVNGVSGAVEFADEVWDYTGENFGKYVDTAKMSDEELVKYLTNTIPEAYDVLNRKDKPVTAKVPSTTVLSVGVCRDIYVGIDQGTHFDLEKLYTISRDGAIYEHFPMQSAWIAVNENPANR